MNISAFLQGATILALSGLPNNPVIINTDRRKTLREDPHDMDMLEEVEDLTDIESESFAVFNEQ